MPYGACSGTLPACLVANVAIYREVDTQEFLAAVTSEGFIVRLSPRLVVPCSRLNTTLGA